jgi:hypothetical protein
MVGHLMGERRMGDDGPKVEGQPPPPLVAPALQAGLHPAPSIGPALFTALDGVPHARTPVSEGRYHGEQGMYLAASGTLTQFNAILAALLTAALSLKVSLIVKIVIGVALALHAVAGFLLCWAARPIANADGTPAMPAEILLARSLQNYRRGWRATMLALAVSVLVLASLTWEKLVVTDLLPLIR